MKAVFPQVPAYLRQQRQCTGVDRWDEMWEGVLHVPPMPSRKHQKLEGSLERWLWQHWAQPHGAEVYHQINVASPGSWPKDFRIPDLVLLAPDRSSIDRDEYFDGPPSVVVEIRSPGDETEEKISFYEKIGAPELWIVDRDTKVPEIYVLHRTVYEKQKPDSDGWIESPSTAAQMRAESPEKLAMEIRGKPETRQLLPE